MGWSLNMGWHIISNSSASVLPALHKTTPLASDARDESSYRFVSCRAEIASPHPGEGWDHHRGTGSATQVAQGDAQGLAQGRSQGKEGPIVKALIDSRFLSICSTSDVLPMGGSGSLRGWSHELLRGWDRTTIKQSRRLSASVSRSL